MRRTERKLPGKGRIMKEIMTHWPTEATWEGRLETALYTQGGLVFAASLVIGGVILIRGSW